MADDPDNIALIQSQVSAAAHTDGAQFWVYISPHYNTEQWITRWTVTFRLGEWSGSISSENPQEILKTPGLSGEFDVVVTVSGPEIPEREIAPLPDSTSRIGCNANCAAMVGIVVSPGLNDANYWTLWNALCN